MTSETTTTGQKVPQKKVKFTNADHSANVFAGVLALHAASRSAGGLTSAPCTWSSLIRGSKHGVQQQHAHKHAFAMQFLESWRGANICRFGTSLRQPILKLKVEHTFLEVEHTAARWNAKSKFMHTNIFLKGMNLSSRNSLKEDSGQNLSSRTCTKCMDMHRCNSCTPILAERNA